jgi:DNA-binding transcriptional MerR regulator
MLATSPRHIGDLAAELRINPRTIRYYERIGLLPEPERSPSGYRQYSAHDAERLMFILKAKTIGLSLDEIRGVLVLRDAGQAPCEHVAAVIDEKVAVIDAQMRALQDLKDELLTLSRVAKATTCCEGSVCSIIEGHESVLRNA